MATKLIAPSELNLDGWWLDANCRGLQIKQVTPKVCAGCTVTKECIWTAMTKDDRHEEGMFIRGGLTGYIRDKFWYAPKYRSNRLEAFDAACREAERVRETIVNK